MLEAKRTSKTKQNNLSNKTTTGTNTDGKLAKLAKENSQSVVKQTQKIKQMRDSPRTGINPKADLRTIASQAEKQEGYEIPVVDARRAKDGPTGNWLGTGVLTYDSEGQPRFTGEPGLSQIDGKYFSPAVYYVEPEPEKIPTQPASVSPPATPRPTPEIVAANQSGSIQGDPHFVGFDGEKFDFQGHPGGQYLLLQDSDFLMDSKFEKWKDGKATVMTEIGGTVGGKRFDIGVNGAPKVDGKEMKEGQTINLGNGSSVTWDGKNLRIKNGEYEMVVKRQDGFLDIDAKTGPKGVLADGRAPTGILGQTAIKDKNQRQKDLNKFEIKNKNLFDNFQRPLNNPQMQF